MQRFVRPSVIIAIGALAAISVFVLVWFQPQKLLIDNEVNEELPGASQEQSGAGDAAVEQENASGEKGDSEPRITTISEGAFRALAHPVSGRAALLDVGDGDRYLRLEPFMVENGPDLRVYLSAAGSQSDAAALAEDFIDLGALKGNVGDQNYRIPSGTDISRFRSAVIWCRRFSVGFAVAPLDA